MTSINIDFGPVIREVRSAVSEVDRHVSMVEGQVGQVSRDLSQASRELQELKKQFDEWVNEARKTAAVQRAETVVGNLKADLDRKYGHYRVVRRSSIGTLEALDVGIVSNKSVQQVSEELMIQTPRYWLAPALVAVAAWSRDDQELAERAVSESFSRDRSKCSLFFALVLQRQGRLEGASRWIRHYLRSLDPLNLPREFAVILEALARNGFGLHGRHFVEEQLDAWLTMLRDDPAKIAEQVTLWVRDLQNYGGSIGQDQFRALRELSPNWPAIEKQIVDASVLGNAHARYAAILSTRVEVSTDVLAKMDDLLEILVREYDNEELPLRREVALQEAIIEFQGDIGRARQKAALEDQAMAENIDALSMQTYTAMMPEVLGVSVQTQIVSIGALKSEFREAVTAYTGFYRARALSSAAIDLRPDHSNLAMQYDFPGWRTRTDVPQAESEQSLTEVWNKTMDKLREQAAFKPTSLILPIIGAVLISMMFGFHIVALLLLGGAVGFYGWHKKQKAEKELAMIEKNCQQALEVSVDRYRTAMVEFADAMFTYEDADAKEPMLLSLIDSWPSSSVKEAAA